MIEEAQTLTETPTRWDLDSLKVVRYDQTCSRVFARSVGMIQRVYDYETETQKEVGIRRVTGIPFQGSLGELIWVRAFTEECNDIILGIDSAYIFERTGCYITPKIVEWGGEEIVPLMDIVAAAMFETESLLGVQIAGFYPTTELPTRVPSNYIAIDQRRQCKAILLTNHLTLDSIEERARHFCSNYWSDYESMSKKVRFDMSVYLNCVRKYWCSEELATLELGDLVSIQNYEAEPNSRCLRGTIRFGKNKLGKSKYEVFLIMSDESTKLYFGSDDIHDVPTEEGQRPELIAPHEQIELEIHAGKTTIFFNDLCSVQAGTLIELREHALPTVTLCVMGSPILEGELVHFQDQLMVQVTRRLD